MEVMGDMFASHPTVHPLDLELAAAPVDLPPGVLAKDLPGMPGTPGSLLLCTMQIFFAMVSLWFLSYSASFSATKGFWYLVASDVLHCTWSLTIAILGFYAMLVKRSFRNHRAVALFAIGDGITWLVTFTGASAAAGISYFLDNDMMVCSNKHNHCGTFKAAVTLAFCCLFSLSPSLILNLYSIASIHV